MALVDPAPQVAQPPLTTLTWPGVYHRLTHAPPGKLWGVPRGGQIVAGMTGRAVDSPEAADAIVDDIIDSGATRDAYRARFPDKPFWALLDKQPGDGWVVFPWEQADEATADVEDTVRRQLEWLGEDPRRPGLRETPRRVLTALRDLTSGTHEDPRGLLTVTFDEPCDELVVLRDVPFWSLCEHHLLPFHGTATVGYIPRDHVVVGLSKLARLVRCLARRLQTQERLTWQVAHTLSEVLEPVGAGCVIRATHTCMAMRGVQAAGTLVTSALLGALRTSARSEFLDLSAPR